MTNADLDEIESALNMKLPTFYRSYMLDYPRWLPAKQPPWSDVVKWEFADNAERVIKFNRFVRDCAPGEFFDNSPWPQHYFVIGSEAEQNWYFLDLASSQESVFLYHHDLGDVHQEARSLSEFPESLVTWWQSAARLG